MATTSNQPSPNCPQSLSSSTGQRANRSLNIERTEAMKTRKTLLPWLGSRLQPGKQDKEQTMFISLTRSGWKALLVLAISLAQTQGPAKSQETKADGEITATGKRGRPLLGVQRWDMFSGKGATQQKELGYLPGKQGFLKDSQWHDRVPFFCRLTKDVDWIEHPANAGPVWFNHPFSQQLLQESMDQELRYAHNAGIDFFVYHGPARKLYANGWELRNNFDCHLSSKIPEAKKVNFTWALYAHRAIRYTRSKVATMMDETIEYITMPNWQTVMDGRPLIVVYHPERFRAALQVAQGKEHMTGVGFVEYIRARVEAEGLKTPYIVGCMEPRDSCLHAEILKEEGYDAFMDYEGAYGGAVAKRDEAPTYASATEEILKTCEQEYLNRGLPFLPPCPSMHYRWPHAFDRKGQAIEKLHHFQWPKEGDLEARVEAVLDFVASHPEDCEAQTVIMYSWNEHSGGGGICPTMGKSPEYEPETQWLDEVAEALATWKYPQESNKSMQPTNSQGTSIHAPNN